MPPLRVVYDTNIWISGLLWRGNPYRCLVLAREGTVEVLHCSQIIAEISRKLRQPFGFSENHLRAALYDIRNSSKRIEVPGVLHGVVNDPSDDIFVECAQVGGASLIVSGDHHLLSLQEYQGITVVTAAEFVARFIC